MQRDVKAGIYCSKAFCSPLFTPFSHTYIVHAVEQQGTFMLYDSSVQSMRRACFTNRRDKWRWQCQWVFSVRVERKEHDADHSVVAEAKVIWHKLHHSLNMYWTNSYIKFTFPNLEFLCSRNWAIHIPLHIPFKILLSTLMNIFIKGVLLQTICWITVSYRIDVIKSTDDLLELSALLFAAEGKVISKNLDKY